MSVFKCKMCGGTVEFAQGDTVGICDSCGTKQTLPRLDDDKKANLYDRANHFRRNNDFDKAMSIYEQILSEDGTDSEAYWSLVLCRYGIEYVEDPATHKRVPTVNRAQFTSIFDDEDYKSALQYASTAQREVYEQEAAAINEIQKGILAISQKEDPFDVFICYKESDSSGRRTPDSVLANDLYHQLTAAGFKVFFARITLEDKLGTAYEPYIFAALNSAKVMVVLGTRAEYFNAVWVKNEWSRYLALVKKSGGKKALIPAYRDMDPYDLPEEFSHLQAQDMSKLGFMQDLIRGIEKILNAEKPQQTVVTAVESNAGTAPLLKRAFMFLEDCNWQEADEYCEKVLDMNPECAEAYLGKLMVDLRVPRQENLVKCLTPFVENKNYQKAVRFGSESLVSNLKGYIADIKRRNENERLSSIYNKAVQAMNSAKTKQDYKLAEASFKSIKGFKNANDLQAQCSRIIEKIKAQQEAERLLAKQKTEKFVKKIKRLAAITIPVIAVIAAFSVLLTTVIIPAYKSKELNKLFEKQKAELTNLSVGKTVKFGAYEQDNNTSNGKEEIEWEVLAVENKKALIVSKYALDCKAYNTDLVDTTWENCSLRSWLNGTFYKSAFGTEQRKVIETVDVSSDENPIFGTDSGNSTRDRVFLLSASEVTKYYSTAAEKKCIPTEYAIESGAFTSANLAKPGEAVTCWWWLRTTGDGQDKAAIVAWDGALRTAGDPVNVRDSVRPALWLDLNTIS